jgi:hypothetical protein
MWRKENPISSFRPKHKQLMWIGPKKQKWKLIPRLADSNTVPGQNKKVYLNSHISRAHNFLLFYSEPQWILPFTLQSTKYTHFHKSRRLKRRTVQVITRPISSLSLLSHSPRQFSLSITARVNQEPFVPIMLRPSALLSNCVDAIVVDDDGRCIFSGTIDARA